MKVVLFVVADVGVGVVVSVPPNSTHVAHPELIIPAISTYAAIAFETKLKISVPRVTATTGTTAKELWLSRFYHTIFLSCLWQG